MKEYCAVVKVEHVAVAVGEDVAKNYKALDGCTGFDGSHKLTQME